MCNPPADTVRNVDMRARNFVAALYLAALPAFAAGPNLVVNGDFEQNGGAGTNKLTGWTVVSQAGGSGSWYVQTGDFPMPSSERCSAESIQRPPSGFAAMTNMSYKGSHVLYQDVAIPAVGGKVTLAYDLFISSLRSYATQPTLDYLVIPNAQFRADIMDPSAAVDDTGSGVLMNFYQSNAGDPLYLQYDRHTVDVSRFAGRTIRLRFAEADNVDCFNVGLDNVSITVEACPAAAPSQLAISHQCPTGCETGQPVSFFATSPAYVFVACDAYAWDFGDGSNAASANPVHTFAAPGTYTVNLAVTNALGTSTAQTTVTIAPPPPRRRTISH